MRTLVNKSLLVDKLSKEDLIKILNLTYLRSIKSLKALYNQLIAGTFLAQNCKKHQKKGLLAISLWAKFKHVK